MYFPDPTLTLISVIIIFVVFLIKSIHLPKAKEGVAIKKITVRNPVSEDGKYRVLKCGYDYATSMYFAEINSKIGVIDIKSKTHAGLEKGIDETYKRLAEDYDFLANCHIKIVD